MRSRHRRPGLLDRAAEVAERLWRLPLALAGFLLGLAGPAHAFGRTNAVFFAAILGLTLSAMAVPLGLLALRTNREAAS